MLLDIMEQLRTITLSFLSIFSIEVLQYFKDLNAILFTIIQVVIGFLTIIYLYNRIKLTRNENKKFNNSGSDNSGNTNDNISVP